MADLEDDRGNETARGLAGKKRIPKKNPPIFNGSHPHNKCAWADRVCYLDRWAKWALDTGQQYEPILALLNPGGPTEILASAVVARSRAYPFDMGTNPGNGMGGGAGGHELGGMMANSGAGHPPATEYTLQGTSLNLSTLYTHLAVRWSPQILTVAVFYL